MVNGNYVLYGDRPSSGSEIVEDHVQTRTAERKSKRKMNRSANELQLSLNLAQVDNETDSIKYEKKVKEPRLLRYVPTSDVEENFITDKFETYDPLASEQRPRRYPFTKKPKNPSDGSLYYSRSNSSSPSGNLPTIAEHNEAFGTYRVQGLPKRNDLPAAFESKLDKYFVKPRESKKYDTKASYNGSHPDSLYRVPTSDGVGAGKLMRVMRTIRWPAALLVVCTALAVFVYFLMPDNVDTDANMSNSTYWEASGLDGTQHILAAGMQKPLGIKKPETSLPNSSGRPKTKTKPPEVDFYDPANDKNFDLISIIDTISGKNKKLPVAPVFPVQVKPEVQYGNEKLDTGKTRVPKILDDENQVTTPKPHITQKPEKPFAVYLENPIEPNPKLKLSETIKKAESSNDFSMYGKPKIGDSIEHYRPAQELAKERPIDISPELQEYYGRIPAKNVDVSFTSGHSKIFGIGIEDAEKIKATTQSSAYNTRVSPTLPPWRDGDDSTTKNYPVNINVDVQECRSTSLAMCRDVLPYDLAGPAPTINGKSVTSLRIQFQYLVTTNCSDRAAQFVCSLLEPECSPSPQAPKTPCYSLCKAVVDSCEQYIDPEIAPAFRCKQYENNNCVSARAPCSRRELACGDGTCVPRDYMCDGTKDCPAGEDEKHCTECEKTQFRCPGGSCISKRWLCDGYLDCPEGEDEAEEQCGGIGATEPGEETAGSAPALSVRRPGRPHAAKYRSQVADDSSKELLITSDSNNGLKRNFTRRPALARLTPYRPKQRKTENSDVDEKSEIRTLRKFTPKSATTKPQQAKESAEESDIGFLEEFDKAVKESKNEEFVKKAPKVVPNREHKKIDVQGLEKQIDERPVIEIGKDSNKFERVLNGAQLLKKAAEEEAERARLMNQTSNDEYSFYTNKQPDPAGLAGSTSPCPSGELRCVDGRCITLAQLCDGTIDCSDHADEDNCFT